MQDTGIAKTLWKADFDPKESDAREAVNFGLHEGILFMALSKVIILNLNSSETKSTLEGTLQVPSVS